MSDEVEVEEPQAQIDVSKYVPQFDPGFLLLVPNEKPAYIHPSELDDVKRQLNEERKPYYLTFLFHATDAEALVDFIKEN